VATKLQFNEYIKRDYAYHLKEALDHWKERKEKKERKRERKKERKKKERRKK